MIKKIRDCTFIRFQSLGKLAIVAVFPLGSAAQLEAATTLATGPSSGFSFIPEAQQSSTVDSMGGNDFDSILRGVSTQVGFSTAYNSNIGQNAPAPGIEVLDDVISTLSGSVSYMSKASTITFGGFYRGSYNNYFENSDFSAFNQGGGVVANYQGGRLASTFRAGIDYDEGSNRNYLSALIKRINYSSSLNARYSISSKTTLEGNYSQNTSTVTEGNFEDTSSYDFGLSALWKYSALTEFGPGVRYTYRSGDSNNGRTSVGPTLNANYKLSQKVSLASRVGMDFSTYDSGATADPTFSTSIAANYTASVLWGLNFSLFRDTQADPSFAGSFTEVTSTRLGYYRKIRRAMFRTGISYDINRIDSSGTAGIDRDFITLDASLGMMILSDKYFSSIYYRYSDQSSDTIYQSWDGYQVGFSLSRSF